MKQNTKATYLNTVLLSYIIQNSKLFKLKKSKLSYGNAVIAENNCMIFIHSTTI